ncbi:flippase [Diplocloster modestus]|uniref:Flippase n=1 Tax=Diplocloster modestus TaxID=2850322 RepID=A0ABS6K3V5_9FIRM|nr:flippase [Diplocloster modestus]MBU9725203.1 flippase [Diplocloster modestus]
MEKIENPKSIKFNMLLNSIKSLMGVIFPLITFPYIARVLGVDNIGRYNFANSVISYFVLLAGLGISTYGIRSGAEIRNDPHRMNRFVNQLFTINIYSTILSYMLLAICIVIVNKFHGYTWLFIILSGQILFKTLGIEWLYSIFEDYAYITVRSIAFQLISLVLMFIFVRSSNDVNIYAGITVLSAVGSNILNFVHAKKYVRIRLTNDLQIKNHLRPILIFFATAVTVVIYVNSDTTILGLLCSDETVGIYSVSVNVYKALKTVLSAIIVVSIPRMSMLWGNGRRMEFALLGKEIYQTFLTLVFPAIMGVIILSKEIVYIISGPGYEEAQWSLIILSVSLMFCLGAGFWSQGVLIPQGNESKVFKITVISAVVNIILNFILIPFWNEKAAALTTLIAEALVFFYCREKGKNNIKRDGTALLLTKVLVGCVPMYFIYILCSSLFHHWLIKTLFVIISCLIEYILVETLLKNMVIVSYRDRIRSKISKQGKDLT